MRPRLVASARVTGSGDKHMTEVICDLQYDDVDGCSEVH